MEAVDACDKAPLQLLRRQETLSSRVQSWAAGSEEKNAGAPGRNCITTACRRHSKMPVCRDAGRMQTTSLLPPFTADGRCRAQHNTSAHAETVLVGLMCAQWTPALP